MKRKNYTLQQYLDEEPGRAKAVCAATGISQSWLSQIKLRRRAVPPMDAVKIDRATGGLVACEVTCPEASDLFSYLRLTGARATFDDDPSRP